MTKISRSFRSTLLLPAALAAASLTACSKVEISTPAADAVVPLPGSTHVVVTSSRSISNVKLAVDGTDMSNQIAYLPATGNYEANLTLAGGMHTAVASADAYCSYCTGQSYRSSDTKTFCVSGTPGITSKTMFAQGDNLGWSSATAHTVAIAADAGTETKWTLWPKGQGIVSVPGFFQSRMFPCSCVRSPNDNDGAAMELAPCDFSDARQTWDATQTISERCRVLSVPQRRGRRGQQGLSCRGFGRPADPERLHGRRRPSLEGAPQQFEFVRSGPATVGPVMPSS